MRDTDLGLDHALFALRLALGAGVFLAGLDKFFDVLTTWSMYLSPLAERLLPVAPGTFLRAVGVVEMALGLGVLTRHARAFAAALALWLLAIALNLALARTFWDLVVRDLQLAAAAYATSRLAAWHEARNRSPLRPAPEPDRAGGAARA